MVSLSSELECWYRLVGERRGISEIEAGKKSPFRRWKLELEVDWKEGDVGKWMRLGVGVANCDDGEPVLCTETPVVLGDNGIAMMGAGIVCRFWRADVPYSFVISVGRA
jgi:hypothetical protein